MKFKDFFIKYVLLVAGISLINLGFNVITNNMFFGFVFFVMGGVSIASSLLHRGE